MRQSRKAKKEILKQKNKISQKKSRERKKLDIIKLVQENKQLKVKIETISSKLCEKCKKLLNKESNEEKKTQFLLSNTPHMSLPSSAKLLTYFTSIVVIFCLLCNFSPQISFLLKTSLNSNKIDYYSTSIHFYCCFSLLRYGFIKLEPNPTTSHSTSYISISSTLVTSIV